MLLSSSRLIILGALRQPVIAISKAIREWIFGCFQGYLRVFCHDCEEELIFGLEALRWTGM